MTVKTISTTTRKTKMIRNIACTAAISGAAMLPIALPTAASALTVAQTSSSTGASNLRGQSFTPSVIGTNGSGVPPASGNVTLNSFTFAYSTAASRTAPTLYIYSSPPTLADLNTGTGALYSSTGLSDSAAADPQFGFPSRTFTFSGASLDVNTTYYALLPQNQFLRYNSSNPYAGGNLFFDSFGTLATASSLDAAFSANLSDPTAVPFAFNPLIGLGGAGLLKAGRKLSDRLRNQKAKAIVS